MPLGVGKGIGVNVAVGAGVSVMVGVIEGCKVGVGEGVSVLVAVGKGVKVWVGVWVRVGVLVQVDGGGNGVAVSVGGMMRVVWAKGLVVGWVAAAIPFPSRCTCVSFPPATLNITMIKKNNNKITPARAIVSKLERDGRS